MKVLRNILLVLFSGALLAGCAWLDPDEKDRKSFTNVVILYQAGYYPGSNDLTIYLNKNLQAVEEGYIPTKNSENVLVLVSHKTSDPKTSPSIVRMYKKTVHKKTIMQRDTLKYYGEKDLLTDPDTMNDILTFIGEKFPSKQYGMIFSSHGTGWLPQGYYSNPKRVDPDYTNGEDIFFSSGLQKMSAAFRHERGVPHVEVPPIDGIMVKSLGVESRKPTGSGQALDYEIELNQYCDCFPYHLDYIIMDACFMGGVESVWQLRNICDRVVVSPAEILASGMVYDKMLERLCRQNEPDLVGVAADFYEYYNSQTGVNRSGIISCIDCTALTPLAVLCRELFETYRTEIAAVKPSEVQVFFRSGKHWFYDLADILKKAGISQTDAARLDAALSQCVLFKAHTPTMLRYSSGSSSGFDVNTFCGLSMYLPSAGTPYLNNFYKGLEWNEAVSLVK